MTADKPDLEKLRALAEASTPGPWHHNNDVLWSMVTLRPNGFGDFICSTHRVGAGARDDAAFIAAARTAVPWLLDRVAELERELAEWADWAKLVGEISAEQVGRGTSVEQANRRAFHVAEERDELRVELADERRKREEAEREYRRKLEDACQAEHERSEDYRRRARLGDAAQRENAIMRKALEQAVSSPDLGALYGIVRAGVRDDAFGQGAREALKALGNLVAEYSKVAREALSSCSPAPAAEGTIVEVRRMGFNARLFVNGHGIADWPWEGPCANLSTGEEYAAEVARCLRNALASTAPAPAESKETP